MGALLQLAAGAVLGGDYRVLSPLGAGGMGAVYVVEQLSTGKRRALKVMHPGLVEDARSRERFVQEARVGALIRSDHVVEVLAAGVDADTGMPWIAMELLEGEDLGGFVRHHGYLSARQLCDMLEQLCHALGTAHAGGVVHRDIKPENVFVTRARSSSASLLVKVLDFGIAKVAAHSQTTATATIGSPAWMAPEQTDPRAAITPATDVWALGLMAFWLLTGRAYWSSVSDPQSSLHALLKEILIEPIVPASTRAVALGVGERLPPGFDAWFARCVDRDPSERFPSATAAFAGYAAVVGAAGPEAAAAPQSSPFSFARGATMLSDLPPALAALGTAERSSHEVTDFAGLPPAPALAPALGAPMLPPAPRSASDLALPRATGSEGASAAGAGDIGDDPTELESEPEREPEAERASAEAPVEPAPAAVRAARLQALATEPSRSAGRRGFALGLGVALVGLVAVLVLGRGGEPERTSALATVAEAPVGVAASAAAPSSASADPPAARTGAEGASAPGDGPSAVSAAPSEVPGVVASVVPVAVPRGAATARSPAPPPTARPFDYEAAEEAVQRWARMAEFACRGLEGAQAFGVTLTLEPSGGVRSLRLSPDEPWSASGNCVSGHLRGIRVEPFVGGPQVVGTSVGLAPRP
ncbi:MAG: serine/threonine protein kinase [Polyangiaceae bacterium]|nr:serine/threonine protein kinase [Polyangiaceae bacterium]